MQAKSIEKYHLIPNYGYSMAVKEPKTPDPAPEITEAAAAPAAEEKAKSAEQPWQEKIASLEAEIASLEAEIASLRDQRVRALAETDNVRKRAQRDLDESSKYAISGFARDLVSVLENLKRASANIHAHAEGSDLIKSLDEGVDLTLQELLAIFDRYGIKRIDPMGQKFDHNFHQAVAQIEKHDVPPGIVVQVVQAGYVIHDRLLRPAMVAVSKQAETPPKVDTKA